MKTQAKFQIFLNCLLILILVILIIPFVYLIQFNYPTSDDYSDFMVLSEYGFINKFIDGYLSWGGRFSSYLLVWPFNPVDPDNFTQLRIINVLSIGITLLFLWFVTVLHHRLYHTEFGRLPVFTALAILLFGYVKSPVQLFYWYTCSLSYLPGLVLITGWLLIAFPNKDHKVKRIENILFYVLPFLIAGTNEINIIIFGFVFLFAVSKKQKSNKAWMASGMIFLLGAGIELLAPGNGVRQDYFAGRGGNKPGDISFTLLQSLKAFWYYQRDWLRATPIIPAGLILYFSSGNKKYNLNKNYLIRGFLVGIIFLICLFFPFYWGTGRTSIEHRILNVIFICWFMVITFGISTILRFYLPRPNIHPAILVVLFIYMTGLFTYTSNVRVALYDIQIAGDYHTEMQKRIQKATDASKNNPSDTLVLKPIISQPKTIFYYDMKDASHWYNRGFAYTYGIKAVRIDTSGVNR